MAFLLYIIIEAYFCYDPDALLLAILVHYFQFVVTTTPVQFQRTIESDFRSLLDTRFRTCDIYLSKFCRSVRFVGRRSVAKQRYATSREAAVTLNKREVKHSVSVAYLSFQTASVSGWEAALFCE